MFPLAGGRGLKRKAQKAKRVETTTANSLRGIKPDYAQSWRQVTISLGGGGEIGQH